jgi:CelD/BcsL family acetyltransferase involved in cellulose biosynthesis
VHGTIESLFRVEWRPLGGLAPLAEDWRALAGRALEPNVFYEPAFALAAQPVFGRDVGAGLVWSRELRPRLLGFFPARIERHRYGITLPVLVGWTHAYGPLGTPLVDRDAADAVIAAWFDHVARDPVLPNLMLMPYLAEGPVTQVLTAAIARRRGRNVSFARHQRALLAPGAQRADYFERAIASKKRKELRRQMRRLMDIGIVARDSIEAPLAAAQALDDFFALEAAGWKGRAGTAARADTATQMFMKAAIAALTAEGKARIDRLLVDARPIAIIVALRSGATVWSWKIAYDESFARVSPGVQLLVHVTQTLLDDTGIARADSCATADHPMIDHIWRERLMLSDRLICIGPGDTFAFALACALESCRRASIAAAKSLRDLVRRRPSISTQPMA